MPLTPRLRTPHPVRVVLSTPAVRSFVSVWKAAALEQSCARLGRGLGLKFRHREFTPGNARLSGCIPLGRYN